MNSDIAAVIEQEDTQTILPGDIGDDGPVHTFQAVRNPDKLPRA